MFKFFSELVARHVMTLSAQLAIAVDGGVMPIARAALRRTRRKTRRTYRAVKGAGPYTVRVA